MPTTTVRKKTELDYSNLEYFSNFLKYQSTWAFNKFIQLRHKTIALITGNQAMKTSGCAYQYVLRILGLHPIPEKNILYFECSKDQNHRFNVKSLPKDWICPQCKSEIKIHQRGSRVFRYASETLPGEKEDTGKHGQQLSAETKNTVYPEFKKWLPPHLMKRDITFRSMAMLIYDPLSGYEFCGEKYNGADIVVEFVSYKQTIQTGAGVQRVSIWEDEEAPYDFHEEQVPRLIAEEGDMIMSLTPANKLSWTYDEIFERAHVYIRTKAICDFLRTKDYEPKQIEFTDSPLSIAVIQAATDDNPTLKKEVIEQRMGDYDDPDLIATRRYGIHKQVKGRIFKTFDYKVHFIDKDIFPDGIPHEGWVHGRAIDYHPQTPWACSSVALSPQNEAFVWIDFEVSPEKYTTREICREIAIMGKDYDFKLNLIDPLSEEIKKDNISVLDGIKRYFYDVKKEGIGRTAFWQTWDTKGDRGKDAIKERLKNSLVVERPFNNQVTEEGRTRFLPTIWILNNCRTAAKSMKMWSWEEHMDVKVKMRKGITTDKPQQKWSHMNMALEALFKHQAFRYRRISEGGHRRKEPRYFQGRG